MENIMKYEKLVNKVASMYSNYSNFEDLRQQGMIGLIKAIDNYKPNHSTKFSSYAYIWIKGEILEYLRLDKNIKISKDILALNKEISVTTEILRNKLNREPTTKDIAIFLKKDVNEIEDALLAKELVLSCDYSLKEDENKEINLYDYVPYYQKEYDPTYLDLYNEVEKLPADEKKIISMRYFDDMTQSEVSRKLGTNQVNISRKEEKILTKLHKSLV